MNDSSENKEKQDIGKAVVEGAALGAVLWPAIDLVFDAFAKKKSFTPGNRLKFLASGLAMGAIVNGAVSGMFAWWHNRKHSTNITHVEGVVASRQESGSSPVNGK